MQKKGENNPIFGKSGENHPNYGKPKFEGAGKPSQPIEVTDKKTNQTTTYDSISEAARALNIPYSAITMYFNRNQTKPYKGKYTLLPSAAKKYKNKQSTVAKLICN